MYTTTTLPTFLDTLTGLLDTTMTLTLNDSLNLHQIHQQDPPAYQYVLPALPLAEVGALIAPGGTGKSMYALQCCYAIAGGDPSFFGTPLTCGPVAYLSFEDQATTLQVRLHHIAKNMPHVDLAKAERHVHIFDLSTKVVDILNDPSICQVITHMLQERQCRLCFIDTLSGIHKGDENSNSDMATLIACLRQIAQAAQCSIVYLHHTNKAAALQGNIHLQQSSRGASSLTDNIRWQSFMTTMTEEEAKALQIPPQLKTTFVKFGVCKVNYGAPPADIWYKRTQEGVLTPMTITPPQMNRIADKNTQSNPHKIRGASTP